MLVGLVCPPLAGIRSAAVWICYIIFLVLYSLWALRLTSTFSGDRRLGYLLCLTDAAILLPLLVWSSMAAMQAALAAVWVAGLAVTVQADRTRESKALSGENTPRLGRRAALYGFEEEAAETPLERALRVRLRVYTVTDNRFALVVLRMLRFEEMRSYYGEEESHRLLSAVVRRGLRLMGPDAQHFLLPGGRVAFVFATGVGRSHVGLALGADGGVLEWVDPYDVESFAMMLGRKACEHLVDGHRVECVVGWASAPADGLSPDDLVYAAESGAQSTAAFRRVSGSSGTVPEQRRAAAG